MRTILQICLGIVIFTHAVLVVFFVASFFILPFKEPWWVALPLMTFMFFFTTTNVPCQVTNLENKLRQQLGMKRIGGFVGHYAFKPIKIALGIKQPAPAPVVVAEPVPTPPKPKKVWLSPRLGTPPKSKSKLCTRTWDH